MQLKLEDLQKLVGKVVNKEKNVEALKEELTRAIGPIVVTDYGIKVMAESANDHLDVIKLSGRQPGHIKTSLLTKFMKHEEPTVRRLIARLLPESSLKSMMNDSDPQVRWTVAERLPAYYAKQMHRMHTSDDQLLTIYRKKKIQEAGLPAPVIDDEEFDLRGDGPMGDTARYEDHPGITDTVYSSYARDFIKTYGLALEGDWEETAAKGYLNALASQGIDFDKEKFLNLIYDYCEQRNKNMLSQTAESLRKSEDLDEVFIPIISEKMDPVTQLVQEKFVGKSYIQRFEDLFEVRKGEVENPGKKLKINENHATLLAPVSAKLPIGILREVDERALQFYVRCWNSQRKLKNQPYRLSWAPSMLGEINFRVELT